MIKRNIAGFFQIIIVICFFSILLPAHADEGKPVASIINGAHDFGEIFEGPDAIHAFIIKNTGNADLELKNVKTG